MECALFSEAAFKCELRKCKTSLSITDFGRCNNSARVKDENTRQMNQFKRFWAIQVWKMNRNIIYTSIDIEHKRMKSIDIFNARYKNSIHCTVIYRCGSKQESFFFSIHFPRTNPLCIAIAALIGIKIMLSCLKIFLSVPLFSRAFVFSPSYNFFMWSRCNVCPQFIWAIKWGEEKWTMQSNWNSNQIFFCLRFVRLHIEYFFSFFLSLSHILSISEECLFFEIVSA